MRRSRHSRKSYRGGGIRHSTVNHREHRGDSEQRLRAFTARVDAGIITRRQENAARALAHRRAENIRLTRRTRNGTHYRRNSTTRH
jgi:hypothetical protein